MRPILMTSLAFLTFVTVASTVQGEQVLNGGFETGDFSGWTLSGNSASSYVDTQTTGGAGPAAHSGTYGAILAPEPENSGAASPLFLAQDISTIPGTFYNLTFWLATPRGTGAGSPSTATASWNGVEILTLNDINDEMPYQEFAFLNLPATDLSTPLDFSFTVSEGYWFLDDVSVTPVPEPSSLCLLGVGFAAIRLLRRRL